MMMLVASFVGLSIYQSYLQNEPTQMYNLGEQVIDGNVERRKNIEEQNRKDFDVYAFQDIDGTAKQSKHYLVNSSRIDMPRNKQNSSKNLRKRRIWISMALCFSKNSEMYRKKNYPYAQVTPLAILLWYHFFPDIRILLYLVYDKYELLERRKLYEEQLRQTNVEIRLMGLGEIITHHSLVAP